MSPLIGKPNPASTRLVRIQAFVTYRIGRHFARLLMYLVFRLRLIDRPHLRQLKGPMILAGNHTGLLDTIILIAALDRPVVFITHQGVLDWPVVGPLVKYAGTLAISPKTMKTVLKTAVTLLEQGYSVCIFPEGALTPDGQLQPFKNGAAYLQRQSQAPLLPFYIDGGYEAWPWGRPYPKPHRIQLTFAPPLPFQPNDSLAPPEMDVLITSTLYTTIKKLIPPSA